MNKELMNTGFMAHVDAKALGQMVGRTVWPSEFHSIVSIVFSKASAGYAIAMRYADMEANKIADAQAEEYEYIKNLHDIA